MLFSTRDTTVTNIKTRSEQYSHLAVLVSVIEEELEEIDNEIEHERYEDTKYEMGDIVSLRRTLGNTRITLNKMMRRAAERERN